MEKITARQAFKTVYNGCKNFITPNILKYGNAGDYFYELSYGRLFFTPEMIYGVSVINKNTLQPDHTLLKSFNSQTEAEEYIKSLKKHRIY